MRNLLKLLAVVSTSWVLVATSRPAPPPCTNKTPEQRFFQVEGTCGPSGVISIDSDPSCGLVVDGGEPLFVPTSGTQGGLGSMLDVTTALSGSIAIGGRPPLSDGGTRSPPTCGPPVCNPEEYYRSCVGGPDGGILDVLCTTFTQDADAPREQCQLRLVPLP